MNPFIHLGLQASATAASIQAAFRKRALDCHPDLHPNDPQAKARFVALIAARNLALSDIQGAWQSLDATHARSVGFACKECGDSFDVMSTCPRCDAPLHRNIDEPEMPSAAISETEVNAFLDECGAYRPKLNINNPIPEDSRVLFSGGFLGMFGYTIGTSLGMVGMAAMLITFAAVIVSLDTWSKYAPRAAWARG